MIVRYKRTNESVMHRSKGMHHSIAAHAKRDLLEAIIRVSKLYWCISSLTGVVVVDTLPDLIVDEHMTDEYKFKHDDAGYDCDRLKNTILAPGSGFSVENLNDIRGITALKHLVRFLEAAEEYCAFTAWLDRLVGDTLASMIRSIISYMRDVYVHKVSDGDRVDYRRLVDTIERMSAIFDDLWARAIDGKLVPPGGALFQVARLIDTILEGGGMTYDRCRQTLASPSLYA